MFHRSSLALESAKGGEGQWARVMWGEGPRVYRQWARRETRYSPRVVKRIVGGSDLLIIDVHAHFISPDAIAAARRTPDRYGVKVVEVDGKIQLQLGDEPPRRPLLEQLHTIGRYVEFMKAKEISGAVVGPLMDVVGYHLPGWQAKAWSRILNESLAESLKAVSDVRLHGLASVPLQDPEAAAAELRYAVLSLGFRGAMIDTNVRRRPLGARGLEPFWRTATELGVPVILHPFVVEPVERFNEYYLHNLVGYPFETTLAACSMIFGGMLDQLPELEVVLVHGGGFLPYQVGRLDRGHGTRQEVRAGGAKAASKYLRRFYYDTLTHSELALRFLCETVGADRLLMGSDFPFTLGDPEPVRSVRKANLGAIAETAALGSNAAQLFGIGTSL